jgi:hypothetical protein
MRIDSSGNVGIGTASPASKLDINTGASTGTTDMITLGGLDNASTKQTYAVIQMGIENNTASSEQGNILLQTVESGTVRTRINLNGSGYQAFSNGGSERMRIDSSGNVGIGTTSPSGKLDVRGASYFGTPNTFIIGDDGGTDGAFFNETASVPMRFLTAGTERMRIDSSGVFSFRCTSQLIRGGETYRFQTSGGIASFETSNTDFPVIALRNTGTNGYMMAFNNASAEIGTISSSGSNVSYNTSSDYRLKQDIAPMTNALAKVAALKPVTYKWKSDGADGEGFIAHELAEVCPLAVTGAKDAVDEEGNPRYQGVDTSHLVATLTAAIQEQQALIISLTARIVALESN